MKKLLGIIFSMVLLFLILTYVSVLGTHKEFETCKIVDLNNPGFGKVEDHDSLLIQPNTLYKGNIIKKLMQGENYREAWAKPVKFPVVMLDTLMGGMTIVKEGGGQANPFS